MLGYCQNLQFQKALAESLIKVKGADWHAATEAKIIDEALAAAGLDWDNTTIRRIEDQHYIHIQFKPKH